MNIEQCQFLTGFAKATSLERDDADEQWAGYSRQLSDAEREQMESGGYDAGIEQGREFRKVYPLQGEAL